MLNPHPRDCVPSAGIHEKELERLSTQKLNLVQQEQMLQQLRVNSIVNDAVSRGAAAIEHEIRRARGAEGVDELHDRLEDVLADAAEVLDASARVVGDAANLDEAELLDELEALELEQELNQDADVMHVPGSSSSMAPARPSVEAAPVPLFDPRAARRAQKAREERDAEERELASLSAAMATETPMPSVMAAIWEERACAPRAPALKFEAAMPMMAAACC